MQIESIEIKNNRLFRDAKLIQIPRLCVLVGANGTGKSTLFGVFSFLKDALSMNVGKAVAKRGGYREVASRGFDHEPIEAEEFRDYARRGGQVFISTHSPDFLNALTLDEIYCLRKERGFTPVTRASDSENLRALFEAGDLPGYLWKQGLFEGLNRDVA